MTATTFTMVRYTETGSENVEFTRGQDSKIQLGNPIDTEWVPEGTCRVLGSVPAYEGAKMHFGYGVVNYGGSVAICCGMEVSEEGFLYCTDAIPASHGLFERRCRNLGLDPAEVLSAAEGLPASEIVANERRGATRRSPLAS